MVDPKTVSLSQRTIRFGDTTIELTDDELIWGGVSYLFDKETGHGKKTLCLYATPEEVLQARFPDIMFQVSPEGYEAMQARAHRLVKLMKQSREGA